MDGNVRNQRIAAIAALIVSAALFITALIGIATLDPDGDEPAARSAQPALSQDRQT